MSPLYNKKYFVTVDNLYELLHLTWCTISAAHSDRLSVNKCHILYVTRNNRIYIIKPHSILGSS